MPYEVSRAIDWIRRSMIVRPARCRSILPRHHCVIRELLFSNIFLLMDPERDVEFSFSRGLFHINVSDVPRLRGQFASGAGGS